MADNESKRPEKKDGSTFFDIGRLKVSFVGAVTFCISVVGGFFTAYTVVFGAMNAVSGKADAAFSEAAQMPRRLPIGCQAGYHFLVLCR